MTADELHEMLDETCRDDNSEDNEEKFLCIMIVDWLGSCTPSSLLRLAHCQLANIQSHFEKARASACRFEPANAQFTGSSEDKHWSYLYSLTAGPWSTSWAAYHPKIDMPTRHDCVLLGNGHCGGHHHLCLALGYVTPTSPMFQV